MATPALPFTPYSTTNVTGSFQVQSGGYIQGMARPDPAIQNELAAGILATTETVPMWAGVAIMENIPTASANTGGNIQRATTNAQITGFSVSNQNSAAIKTPQSEVAVTLSGGQVNFYRFGSGARIPLAIDATLATSIQNGTTLITDQVSWDFTNQKIIAYDAGIGALAVKFTTEINVGNSMVAVYNSVANTCNWNLAGAVAVVTI